jgi:hypothetical protein
MCKDCYKISCKKHAETCNNCHKNICQSHAKKCNECNDTYCKECFEIIICKDCGIAGCKNCIGKGCITCSKLEKVQKEKIKEIGLNTSFISNWRLGKGKETFVLVESKVFKESRYLFSNNGFLLKKSVKYGMY